MKPIALGVLEDAACDLVVRGIGQFDWGDHSAVEGENACAGIRQKNWRVRCNDELRALLLALKHRRQEGELALR